MKKRYTIEIDEVERKAIELACRLAYEKWQKLKKATPKQKMWTEAVNKLGAFFKGL